MRDEVSTSDGPGYAPISFRIRAPFFGRTSSRRGEADEHDREAETRDPVPRRGQPNPVAVAVPAAAEAMIKLACVFAAVTVASGWMLARMLAELDRAFTLREGW